MKNKILLCALLFVVGAITALIVQNRLLEPKERVLVKTKIVHTSDTIYRRDTVLIEKPIVTYIEKKEDVPPLYEIIDTIEEIIDTIPFEVKEYKGEHYNATVSGYRPSLDRIEIYNDVTEIRDTTFIYRDYVSRAKRKRWSVNASAGVDIHGKPNVMLGIGYKIFEF